MNKLITNILLPVQLNEEHISVLKQAAELAREHHSVIHLLYVEPASYNLRAGWISKLLDPATLVTRLKEKLELMATWKRWIEKEYGVPATCTTAWGNWKKTVIRHVSLFHADLVILKQQPFEKHWYNGIITSSTEFIIRKVNARFLYFFQKKMP
ncbi:MAG: universal stress protein [Chitinophagaceae bacterium]|nr:universal stress protein [Chitinophagaceae bacterium]